MEEDAERIYKDERGLLLDDEAASTRDAMWVINFMWLRYLHIIGYYLLYKIHSFCFDLYVFLIRKFSLKKCKEANAQKILIPQGSLLKVAIV